MFIVEIHSSAVQKKVGNLFIAMLLVLFIAGLFFTVFAVKANAATYDKPVRIIFETDMGNDVDDAMALDLLYKNMDRGKIKLLAVMSNKDSRYSSEYIDIMNNWYGYPNIPIGKVVNGVSINNENTYTEKVCKIKDSQGKPYFRHIRSYESISEATKLYRKVLSSQPDKSVIIISVGFSTNIARLLDSKPDKFSKLNGMELVARKVKLLSIMGGSFGKDAIAEFNVKSDINSARYVFSKWPTPLVATPFEAGNAVEYPGKSIQNDFGWTKGKHPMVEAYKVYLPMPYNRPTWDVIATLYATDPSNKFFTISKWGNITIDDNEHTVFVEKEGGRHAYLTISPEQAEAARDYFVMMLTKKPAKK